MKVLMVCLGNICRSPMADGWLRHKVKERNLNIVVESAGTANFHVGSPPDIRMIKHARDFGVDISNLKARQFAKSDFDDFDVIFAMDQANQANILKLARNENDRKKVKLFLNELFPNENTEVPDPYYGEASDFIEVIELLDKATDAFLVNLKKTTN
jgi:protein-tyrosine phosphatase